MTEASLTVVMYHYVRDFSQTRFPRLKGMRSEAFCRQAGRLADEYEMVTLESALAFLRGEYRPRRNLCLLTFDDGLKEHHAEVLPVLAERRIPGLFFLTTSAVQEQRVALVHKNHFLMAALDFAEYRRAFLDRLAERHAIAYHEAELSEVRQTYRWDPPEVAVFKYFINHRLSDSVRGDVLDTLFQDWLGDEGTFAHELYLTWEEARQMQSAGMILGGHSHSHVALGKLADLEQESELQACMASLHQNLMPQPLWPFAYPFGKPGTYNDATVTALQRVGFACAFTYHIGLNRPGEDAYRLRRLDPADLDPGVRENGDA